MKIGSENFRASELRRSLETIKANQSLYFPAEEAEAQRADITCFGLYKEEVTDLDIGTQAVLLFLPPHHKWNCQS